MSRRQLSLETARSLFESRGWGLIPPNQYLRDMDDEFTDIWGAIKKYTMISPERGWALTEAVRYVSKARIPGDIVECGVWKGGACLLASYILYSVEPRTERKIWLYDTFKGMVKPGTNDKIASSGQELAERDVEGWWAVDINEVRSLMKKSPLDEKVFKFVAGPVSETLELSVPQKIAILRLDTDWYESTLKELKILYPRLSKGGVLIVDDYGHFTGARKAVDEYFKEQPVLLHRSDYTGRVVVKS
ncbi:macrocin-O-methyltransferase domain protein [Olavius algarvensis spirochete endosymbiont]|uniref:TylF/MycF/NovP-related O-methyltransferase n=1 Tax=Olavius algarvensis spirochete endosymbiont TaxID=260710 RepID=UPI000F2AE327|nr:TylF/MycF/NovP-related O-methyltransferase [Olavius algarvensis spirochete endosymbiont]VDB00786.1 macrocin-O-methyltransferase domain protein [Olavius algarvensis spirochete endosymbiont]